MYGTEKQTKWATDILNRANRFRDVSIALEKELNGELIKVLNKVYKRVDYINKEKDAKAIINAYGYLGLEPVAGRKYKESYRKFLEDILDKNDKIYINQIVEIANTKQWA